LIDEKHYWFTRNTANVRFPVTLRHLYSFLHCGLVSYLYEHQIDELAKKWESAQVVFLVNRFLENQFENKAATTRTSVRFFVTRMLTTLTV